jgi:hypothetical protein
MFKLLRYFSITSLIAFVIVATLLRVFYRQLVLNNLVEIAESKNVALTQAFSNSLWPQFALFVGSASALSPDEIRAHPEIAKLLIKPISFNQLRDLAKRLRPLDTIC